MTTIWPLPQIDIRSISTVQETRPTALLTGSRSWNALNGQLKLPLVIQAEPHQAELNYFKTLAKELPPQVQVVYSVGGGLAAALLLGEVPRIMRPGPPYAIAAVAGAITYVLLDGVNGGIASTACIAVVFIVRIAAERAGLRTTAIKPLD